MRYRNFKDDLQHLTSVIKASRARSLWLFTFQVQTGFRNLEQPNSREVLIGLIVRVQHKWGGVEYHQAMLLYLLCPHDHRCITLGIIVQRVLTLLAHAWTDVSSITDAAAD